jgi:hypothetical protein
LQNIGPPDLSSVWTMYFDGSKRVEVVGPGVVLISPQGDNWNTWYVSNVSIIFDTPCVFYTICFMFCLHFVAFLCDFWN